MANSTTEMSSKIRVKIDPRYKGVYNGLKNKAIGDFHELFFLCVCLGYKKNKRTRLSKKEDCFWSDTILPDEWYAYYSLFVYEHQKDLSCLGNDEQVLSAMQEYANGGMQILIEELLYDYVKEETGSYLVDSTDELSKELLVNVLDWAGE